jgi:hypothetical protein
MGAPIPTLQPLAFWLQPRPGPLLPQLRDALAAASGEALRWAVTAVEPGRGLLVEGVLLDESPPPAAAVR